MRHLYKLTKLIFVAILLTSCSAKLQKISHHDNEYNLTIENNLQDSIYSNKIDDFYSSGTEGTFVGKENINIYYKIFLQKSDEKGAIIISSGRTEAAVKYKELLYDLYNSGYSIYINDHRGQGLSGRMVTDHDLGYIDDFQYYIDDLKMFYDNYVADNKHKKIFLLSHSMGGAIAATYLEQHPHDFLAAAFSSPMLGFDFPDCAVISIIESKEPKYAPGQTIYMDDSVEFTDNHLTFSEIRYNRMLAAFNKTTKARLGGASSHWVYKSCKQFKVIFSNLDKIETPLILFSAEDEKIVATSAHTKFIEELKSLNKSAEGYQVKHAMHELFIANDRQRIDVLTEILDFYSRY